MSKIALLFNQLLVRSKRYASHYCFENITSSFATTEVPETEFKAVLLLSNSFCRQIPVFHIWKLFKQRPFFILAAPGALARAPMDI